MNGGIKNRPRVLVVDDDDAVRETCAALLEKSFEVISVAEPVAALAQLESGTFDALCTDYKMPGMNGLELIHRMAALPDPPAAVLITAYAEYAQRDRSSARATFLLLLKPYTAVQLREIVQRGCDNTRMRRQLSHVSAAAGGRS